ncbi:ParB/RepB/Spo0J family partition protein [Parvularcula sp. LCG005]|uniref:ParB/RepB/Spo0J family partition protein n=1 Tax=Parvularcula sp. LCG005 TaxID=3078805 RepID=UPI0029431753|nr:ParB/RepB/Spo0J family partition protein [Parvularcula sp. LCG005]WOI53301.1 ParB/RepB/Spo0J family partition protein [Parvularcula sp. LCG005]
MARKGLGRGLDAILGEQGAAPETSERRRDGVQMIPIGDIAPDPDQPRKMFRDEQLDELAASIRARGILQPILVRPRSDTGKHLIIAGERRWRASQRAGIHEMPALVRNIDPGASAELALIENVQREDLNPMEEADAYARIRDQYDRKPGDIADAVGKSRSHIANMLRLTQLPDEVRAMVSAGELSMGHGRALLSADDPVALAKEVVGKGLSVRETEKRAAGAVARAPKETGDETPAKKPSSGGAKDADTKSLERDLEAALGLSVAIEHTKKGGTVTLTYDTLDQLDDICRRLMGSAV